MEGASQDLLALLERLAPGTPMREAFGRVIQQGSGLLVVLGDGPSVDAVCTGGFTLDEAHFTPARLAELAKMDGAIVVDDSTTILTRANVHLMPDSSISTDETGSRHRTAERVAKQTGKPVVSISDERAVATLFLGDSKHELENPAQLTAKVNQQLQTLERFRRRLDEAEARATELEITDLMTYRWVVTLLQRAELVARIGEQVERDLVGLGGEGTLARLQLADLVQGVSETRYLVVRDYAKRLTKKTVATTLEALAALPTAELQNPETVAGALGFDHPDLHARPRGLRLLSQVPRLPESVQESVVKHFGDIQKVLRASVEDLSKVNGVGRARAQQLRNFVDRLADFVGQWDEGIG